MTPKNTSRLVATVLLFASGLLAKETLVWTWGKVLDRTVTSNSDATVSVAGTNIFDWNNVLAIILLIFSLIVLYVSSDIYADSRLSLAARNFVSTSSKVGIWIVRSPFRLLGWMIENFVPILIIVGGISIFGLWAYIQQEPKWQPIPEYQIQAMRLDMQSMDPHEVEIVCTNLYCDDISRSFRRLFDLLSWPSVGMRTGDDAFTQSISIEGNVSSIEFIRGTIESRTHHKVKIVNSVEHNNKIHIIIGAKPRN